jgi:DNA-binding protein H-NS
MARTADLKNMDVDALMALRGDVENELKKRAQDLHRQIALLGGGEVKRRGRPAASAGRVSALKGVKVAPKYRGPGGETWAGRGAMPRWLSALRKEGHSVEEFLIGAGGKRKAAAPKKKVAKKKAAKPVRKPRRTKEGEAKVEPMAA